MPKEAKNKNNKVKDECTLGIVGDIDIYGDITD